MMIDALLILITVAILLCIHEGIHILFAKLFRMRIFHIGIHPKPIPHLYVAAAEPSLIWQKIVFLLASNVFTFFQFTFWLQSSYGQSTQWLRIAYVIMLILETNPYYSDYTILSNIPYQKYHYSKWWYLHFLIWSILLLILIDLI